MRAVLVPWKAGVLVVTGCVALLSCTSRPESHPLELGVELRLNAVEVGFGDEGRRLELMAVGESGTVAWRAVHDDATLQTWTLGAARLHDVGRAELVDGALWFVAGSGGAIHVARQRYDEFTWFVQDTGVTADLHALDVIGYDALEARVLVVGDEVVLLGQASDVLGVFTWSVVAPPAGGWGRLRAIGSRHHDLPGFEVYRESIVAGEGGRAWIGDLESEWRALELGTDDDVHDGDYGSFCGDAGLIVSCPDEQDTCSARRFGEADFVSCRDSWWIDSRARVVFSDPEPGFHVHDQLDWQPRAAAGFLQDTVLVGDGGRAALWHSDYGYE